MLEIYRYLKHINVFALLLSLIVMHYCIGAIRVLPNVVLVGAYVFAFLLIIRKPIEAIELKWVYFLFFLPITILLGRPDPIFKPWSRLMLFSVLFLLCSPIIQSEYARKFRKDALFISITISIILTIGSFLAYFLGINFCTISREYVTDYVGVAGHFSGLTRQSMILGPLSGISSIVFFYLYFKTNNIIHLLFLITSIGCVLFASSRIAFLATIVGCVIVLYYFVENKYRFFKYLFSITILIVITFPLWESATTALQKKQKMHAGKELFDSRTKKYEARIDEFSSSPIWGVGFASINPQGKDKFNKRTGTIEPGSSWLAVLSMTGIVGFVMFSTLYYKSAKISINNQTSYLVGLLGFYSVHMIAEGYVFAGGNPNCFLLWLIIGVSVDMNYEPKNEEYEF